MLTLGRARRLRAAIGTLVLTLVLAAAAAQPASAVQGCAPPMSQPDIPVWHLIASNRGVAVCKAYGGRAIMQIADLTEGAKIRLISQYASGQSGSTAPWAWEFYTRTAQQWFNVIPSLAPLPGLGQLVSATNASFFIRPVGGESPLSLPEKVANSIRTYGWVYPEEHHHDPAWSARKRYVNIGHPNVYPQQVRIGSFGQAYFFHTIVNSFNGAYDATVGYEPTYLVGERVARRTVLGVRGSTVYLLSTVAEYTLEDAQRMFQHFAGGLGTSVQLDGGGSSQSHSIYSAVRFGSNVPTFGREVPDALAIYMAP
jgi:hypothetical protein